MIAEGCFQLIVQIQNWSGPYFAKREKYSCILPAKRETAF